MSASNSELQASEIHSQYCFDALLSELKKTPCPSPGFEDAECPLFVTWKIKSSFCDDWNLRGCIGTFSSIPLSIGLRKYAICSAFEDSRFSPIGVEEVPLLKCSISLLVNFEEADHAFDWEVGVHGIRIAFSSDGQRRTATYLPEVAPEQGWDQEECLRSLVRKAGHRGRVDDSLLSALSVTRYQSSKASLTFDEYCRHRSAVRVPVQVP